MPAFNEAGCCTGLCVSVNVGVTDKLGEHAAPLECTGYGSCIVPGQREASRLSSLIWTGLEEPKEAWNTYAARGSWAKATSVMLKSRQHRGHTTSVDNPNNSSRCRQNMSVYTDLIAHECNGMLLRSGTHVLANVANIAPAAIVAACMMPIEVSSRRCHGCLRLSCERHQTRAVHVCHVDLVSDRQGHAM